jgi:hypothetical protein
MGAVPFFKRSRTEALAPFPSPQTAGAPERRQQAGDEADDREQLADDNAANDIPAAVLAGDLDGTEDDDEAQPGQDQGPETSLPDPG